MIGTCSTQPSPPEMAQISDGALRKVPAAPVFKTQKLTSADSLRHRIPSNILRPKSATSQRTDPSRRTRKAYAAAHAKRTHFLPTRHKRIRWRRKDVVPRNRHGRLMVGLSKMIWGL